ncbi:SdpI family protein [Actinokineospora bangkokensis]|uniref:SdpI family protein n=1 Tax=Actinokineospora bangkokensis TaxID=1193682 RepID=A0A1Q9LG75_9PSEU|nr:SdpI family protein [Actinokineospora bangkokensis]OLR91042.1 hypothetical protein BJP25_31370 [Actinokineospora bangkokensis]
MNLVPLAPLIAGLPLVVVGLLGLTGRLPRNRFGGVRTAATMRSDEAFRVGNKVAGLPTVVAGAVGVLGAVLAWAMPSVGALLTVAVLAFAGLVVITLGAGVLGNRAAEAVPEPAPEVPAGCAGCQCGGCGAFSA